MADTTGKGGGAPTDGGGGAAGAPPAKRPAKLIGIVAGMMIAEAAAVVFFLGMGGPASSHGAVDPAELEAQEEGEQTQEILIAEEKYQNLQTGRIWIWDAAVYAQVKNKHADHVAAVLEQRSAEVQEGISQIFSRAQHAQLKEPERQTLNGQFAAYFKDVFGDDGEGKSVVERVLIPRCRGFPAE